jgi:hypothetical protein
LWHGEDMSRRSSQASQRVPSGAAVRGQTGATTALSGHIGSLGYPI